MIATFHQLNAYVQIAQIPSSASKRLSRRLVNLKLQRMFIKYFLNLFVLRFKDQTHQNHVSHQNLDQNYAIQKQVKKRLL